MVLESFIIENETLIRFVFFVGSLLIMAIWEVFAPKRALTVSKGGRWANNLGLVVFNTLIMRLVLPMAAVAVAVFSAEQGWGLLNYFALGPLMSLLLALVALDFVIYCQHVLVHAVPLLWRVHRVHHADLDYDVTTGSRFHSLEIMFSMLVKFVAIMLIGAPVVAVIIFEVLLSMMAMFNHANVNLPATVDKLLRYVIVTPDMHRVHHGVREDEVNRNFGFNLPWWDRLFGTYRAQPRDGHQNMRIGIHAFREAKDVIDIRGMLSLPFKDGCERRDD